jgi:hypothetical protein
VRTLAHVIRPWTEDRIRRELEAFLPGRDSWPSYPEFRAAGRRGLWQAIARRGGPARFAEEYGLAYSPGRRPVPTDAEVRARLRAVLRGSDVALWPSREWLAEHGGVTLVNAMIRTGGATRWAHEFGVPLQRPRLSPWTPEAIARALEPLLAGRRTWPSRREFEAAGLGSLYDAITRSQGHRTAAARCGLPLQRPWRRRVGEPRPG